MIHVKSQESRTQYRGVAQLGSASALGAEGRRFESCRLDQKKEQWFDTRPLFFFYLTNINAFGILITVEIGVVVKL